MLASTLAPIGGSQSAILSPALLIFRSGARGLWPGVARLCRGAIAALEPIVHGRCVPLQSPAFVAAPRDAVALPGAGATALDGSSASEAVAHFARELRAT